MNGEGCKKCAVEAEGLRKRSLIEPTIINSFKRIHGNRYDYSKVIYLGSGVKVEIVCKKHGSFWQAPAQHKTGNGCPICKQSKGELQVKKYLDFHGIPYVSNKRFPDCRDKEPLSFDFFIPGRNLCIEYDGELHYKSYENSFKGTYKLYITQEHDKIKTQYCMEKGIHLIRIPYWRKNKINSILNRTFKKYKSYTIIDLFEGGLKGNH